MNRTQKMFVAVSMAFVLLAAAVVTATSCTGATPLYTIRMEQASSEKHFLPTERSSFTYTTENGCTVLYDVEYCGTLPAAETIIGPTCWDSCDGTCDVTCWETCPNTCEDTCPNTCPNTCWYTCPYTCWNTCVGTCPDTCIETCNTCYSTCPYTCQDTCYGRTCYDTCPPCSP